jgi:hypothetical protein
MLKLNEEHGHCYTGYRRKRKKEIGSTKRMTRNNVPGAQTKNIFAGRVN